MSWWWHLVPRPVGARITADGGEWGMYSWGQLLCGVAGMRVAAGTDEVMKKFKVGDPITAMVVELNPSTQKLSLSIKEMIKRSQQYEIAKYIHDDDDESDTFSLADMVRYKDEA